MNAPDASCSTSTSRSSDTAPKPDNAAVPAVSYLLCSTTLTLANKQVFSSDSFNFPWSILTVQSCVVVVCLTVYHVALGRAVLRPALLRQIVVPCLLFTLYLFTNSRALRHLSLPVLSVLKSLAPMGVAIAERVLYGDPLVRPVLLAMLLILLGNGVTLLTNRATSTRGFVWAFVNVAANIAHVLSLRVCLSDEFTPVQKTLHSNLVAWLLMLPLAAANRELVPFVSHWHATSLAFRATFALSCVLAAAIGASVFWLVQKTSGSTLSFVGACNKFAVVILGALLFDTTITPLGWVSIAFGVSAGVIFAVAKAKEKDAGLAAKRLASREDIGLAASPADASSKESDESGDESSR